ncbi:MAG: amino acid ABC transporter permease [Lachnospiraceae bacterium]|nr:amino acid ABC transporter permease [Lachnospiraceae bacterium]
MSKVWEIILESFWPLFTKGLLVTIPLTAISFAIALLIAVIVALIQYAKVPVLTQIARFYIWLIRGTPLLVQLFIVFYGLPGLGIRVNAFWAAVFVFSVCEGAYCAETIRGALEAVPYGQTEAGYCVGMNFRETMWHIVLPQAFRNAFPALMNSLISMVKDTSLAANITVNEMFMTGQRIAGRTYQFLAIYIEVAFIYLMFCTVLSLVQKKLEGVLGRYEKKDAA